METERKAIELNQLKTMEGAKFIRKTKADIFVSLLNLKFLSLDLKSLCLTYFLKFLLEALS